MILPLLIHKDNRGRMGVIAAVVFILGYTIPNHFHLFPPQQLPLNDLDRAIPFVPAMIWIYLSEYVMFALAYFQFKSELNRNRYIWTYFGVIFVGGLSFVFFPTTYPRELFPLPGEVEGVTRLAFDILRQVDTPSNCFPSMHVSCCYLTAFSFAPKEESRGTFWFYFVWATLVAISTLPTKQHYVADVISGGTLAVLGYWFFFRTVRYVSLADFVARLRLKVSDHVF